MEEEDRFMINVVGSYRNQDSMVMIAINSPSENVINGQFALGKPISVLKRDLPHGLLKISAEIPGLIPAGRLVFNGFDRALINTDSISPIEIKTEAALDFDLHPHAIVSISITRDRSGLALPSYYASLINSAIEDPVPAEFYMNASHSSLDQLLIASNWKYDSLATGTARYLPESGYDLLQGRIMNYKNRRRESDYVSFTIPGKIPQTRIVRPTESGHFLVDFDTPLNDQIAYLKWSSSDSVEQLFEVEKEFYQSYSKFPEVFLALDSAKMAEIAERSLNNQIENEYHEVLPDEDGTSAIPQIDEFKTYYLNDYTRFATLRDTFLEYVPEVDVSRNERDYRITVRIPGGASTRQINDSPLLLVDGLPVSEKELIEHDPDVVRQIDVLNKVYYFGPVAFNGIISLRSFYVENRSTEDGGKSFQIVGFHNDPWHISVEEWKNPRIPDWRELLYWDPAEIVDSSGKLNCKFYTSEVTGKFMVSIDGLSPSGAPIALRRYFEVVQE